MFRFLKSVRVNLFKTLSTIYHNLYVWYHDHSTKFVIFQLHLNFIYFFTFLPHDLHHDTRTKCKKIDLHFMYMVLEMSHEHEYHFSNKFALWFYALAVHIRRIRKNTYKEVKLLNIANKDKMAPILNMYIVWVYVEQGKSLGSKMWSSFWKLHRE
jgi:hypothetical protein